MRRPAFHVLVLFVCALACACRGRGVEDGAPLAPPEGPAIRADSPSQGALEDSGFLDDEPAWVRIGERLVVTPALADDLLDVPVPSGGEPGPVGVDVVTAKGRAWSEDAFVYDEAPGTLALILAVGFHDPLFGGTRITIQVANHPPLATPRVVFGGVDAASVTMVDDRTLCAEVPDGFPPGAEADIEVEDDGTLVVTGFLVQCTLRPGDLVATERTSHPRFRGMRPADCRLLRGDANTKPTSFVDSGEPIASLPARLARRQPSLFSGGNHEGNDARADVHDRRLARDFDLLAGYQHRY